MWVCVHRLPCCAVCLLLIMAAQVNCPLLVVPCCVSVAHNGCTGCLLLAALCHAVCACTGCPLLVVLCHAVCACTGCPLLVVLCHAVCACTGCPLLVVLCHAVCACTGCPLLAVLCHAVCACTGFPLLAVLCHAVCACTGCPLLAVLYCVCICQLLMMAEKGFPRGLVPRMCVAQTYTFQYLMIYRNMNNCLNKKSSNIIS